MWDLNKLPYSFAQDDEFDEIHAYDVLEHLGTQGDYKFFFGQFNEFARMLKPGGFMCITLPTPNGIWAFAEPGHTRLITMQTLIFLQQSKYTVEVGNTSMSDYRDVYTADFDIPWHEEDPEGQQLRVVLQVNK